MMRWGAVQEAEECLREATGKGRRNSAGVPAVSQAAEGWGGCKRKVRLGPCLAELTIQHTKQVAAWLGTRRGAVLCRAELGEVGRPGLGCLYRMAGIWRLP